MNNSFGVTGAKRGARGVWGMLYIVHHTLNISRRN